MVNTASEAAAAADSLHREALLVGLLAAAGSVLHPKQLSSAICHSLLSLSQGALDH
jgi:hypothetical protein